MNENQVQVPVTENDSDAVIVDPLDQEAIKKAFETTNFQKKHWREQAKKEREEKASLQKQLEDLKKQAEDKTKLATEKPQEPLFDTLADNLAVLRNLGDDEVNDLRAEAKALDLDPIKYIKSKAGQAHLKEYRAGKQSNEATPTPSNRVPVFNGKPVKQIFTDPNVSAADKQAAFESRFRTRGVNSSQ